MASLTFSRENNRNEEEEQGKESNCGEGGNSRMRKENNKIVEEGKKKMRREINKIVEEEEN